jgi:hypothetical protein
MSEPRNEPQPGAGGGDTDSDRRPTNRLAAEKSPYLLQHRHNPVDWYPWGDEAFAAAAAADKPVFLSVGYATCHWCHVMERESFEHEATAARLNEIFIPVKVDREERPEVDDLYMTVCQLMSGRGGWPLTVLLTPDRRPFFAGTYFPREARFGQIGMRELIDRVETLWRDQREKVHRSAETLMSALEQESRLRGGEALDPGILERAGLQLAKRYDPEHGGFGGAPKFPTPHNLLFLLRLAQRSGEAAPRDMVLETLEAMRRGGMFDQLGWGFHRYATDARWHLPHFEKMLYDQALMALAYLEGYQVSGEAAHRETAEQIFSYVLRDLRGPAGELYTAEDADSEGEEGRFYVWTEDELCAALDGPTAALARQAWGVEAAGNFADEATGQKSGANVLYQAVPPEQLATEHGLAPEQAAALLEQTRERLLQKRAQRSRPLLDDKVLTDLNGLAIAALARGARVLDEPAYAEAARRAAQFVNERLRRPDGRLLHRYRDGEAGIDAYLDDHAFFIWGLLELYEATFDPAYLRQAVELQGEQDAHFWDEESGGYFLTADDGEMVLLRRKVIHDGAVPSGNSVAALNLLRLSRITAEPALEQRAQQLLRALSKGVSALPVAHTHLLCALDFGLGPTAEIVVAGEPDAPDTAALLQVLREAYLPRAVRLLRDAARGPALDRLTGGFTAELVPRAGATAYVCQGHRCDQPISDAETLRQRLSPDEP